MNYLPPLTRLRLQRDVEHLYALGPRAVAEFLLDVDHHIGGLPAILRLLAEYERRLTPEMLRRIGADRFPPRVLRVVPKS